MLAERERGERGEGEMSRERKRKSQGKRWGILWEGEGVRGEKERGLFGGGVAVGGGEGILLADSCGGQIIWWRWMGVFRRREGEGLFGGGVAVGGGEGILLDDSCGGGLFGGGGGGYLGGERGRDYSEVVVVVVVVEKIFFGGGGGGNGSGKNYSSVVSVAGTMRNSSM